MATKTSHRRAATKRALDDLTDFGPSKAAWDYATNDDRDQDYLDMRHVSQCGLDGRIRVMSGWRD